jgi:hypothetical protein
MCDMGVRELWGSLSVADHIGARALVADVLLFDRVVTPTPPTGDEEEERRWVRNKWDPARQRRFLSILGQSGGDDDLAVTVPWTQAKRDRFQALSEASNESPTARSRERAMLAADLRFDSAQLKPDAQMMTRMILTREYDEHEADYAQTLPRTWVESIVPAYASFKMADQELKLRVKQPAESPARKTQPVAQVIGWSLFVPANSDWSDEKSLEEAAKLARTENYRLERESFRDWWRSNVGLGLPAENAVRELAKRADRLNKIAKARRRRTRTLRAFAVFGGATSAATFWFPPVAVPSGLIAVASVGAEALMKSDDSPAALAPAAMFYDARKQLGWY